MLRVGQSCPVSVGQCLCCQGDGWQGQPLTGPPPGLSPSPPAVPSGCAPPPPEPGSWSVGGAAGSLDSLSLSEGRLCCLQVETVAALSYIYC